MAGPTDTKSAKMFQDFMDEFNRRKGYAGHPGITTDDKTVQEFIKAIADGKVPEFFAKHPDLTRDDFYALYRLVGEQQTATNEPGAGEYAGQAGLLGAGSLLGPLGAAGMLGAMGLDAIKERTGILGGGSDKPSEEALNAARQAVTTAAGDAGYQADAGGKSPYEFATSYLDRYIDRHPEMKSALDSITDPAAQAAYKATILNGLVAEIVKYNPQLQQMDTIPEGYAVDMGFLPQGYEWKAGDTLQTVAADRGITPDQLRQWMIAHGVTDPEGILPHTTVILPPPRPEPSGTASATGGRGEQTQPETNFPTDTSNPTTPTDTSTPGGGGGSSTNSDTELVNRIIDYGGSQALIADILAGKGMDPSERARLIGKGPQLDALNQLMLATGAFDITGQENARDNFASLLGSPPSSAAIRDQLLGLGTPGAEGSPSDAYLQNPDNPMNALAVLMNQSLGSRAAGTFLTPATVATIQAQLANQQQSDPSASIIPLLHSLGWI